MKRSGAILLHITSLASPYGIGTLGEAALRFVDFLSGTGVRYWQLLPIGPTGYGNSPYQCTSTFAGNPWMIDLDELIGMKLLTSAECALDWGDDPRSVNFERIGALRDPLLRKAFERASVSLRAQADAFAAAQADWMDDYTLYMAIRKQQQNRSFPEWPAPLRNREPWALDAARTELAAEIAYQRFVQYLFFYQFARVKSYAAVCGVELIGDLPIYVSADSADVWANQGLFELDAYGRPARVAGVPPDVFTADGQRWGNPLYRWDAMATDGYAWWVRRMRAMLTLFNVVRIDHFRGFDQYWAVPADCATAKKGEWVNGPGMQLFDAFHRQLGELPIIAEDLGILTESVGKLLADTGFPGMKVLQFAFGGGNESAYLPHRYLPNAVVYTGTHDNDTIRGFLDTEGVEVTEYCRAYLGIQTRDDEVWAMIRAAWASVCNLAVTTAQDLLELPTEARMNTPGSVGGRNWRWRLREGEPGACASARLKQFNALYGRV